MLLFASDLDNTLIFSYKRKGTLPVVCVETKEGKPLSYMTTEAYAYLQRIEREITFVPVTTRSLEQYRRIQLLEQGQPLFALTTNGGILLIDGKIDTQWLEETKRYIEPARKVLQWAESLLQQYSEISFEVRLVDDIFVYTKSNQPTKTAERLRKALEGAPVFVDTNGEKIYVFPQILGKGFALERLRNKLSPTKIFAAGDSSFDIPMLEQADIALWSGKESLQMKGGQCYSYTGDVTAFGQWVLEEVEKRV